MAESDDDFAPSKLGTKEFWDGAYDRELLNFEEHGDVGEIWFGENSLNQVIKCVSKLNGIQKNSSILDLGSGNGVTCIELAKLGYSNILGVDYSLQAVQLAQRIAEKEEVRVDFQVDDILNSQLKNRYQLVLDKGTFDAISLSENKQQHQQTYISTLQHLLDDPKEGYPTYFLITSCNFTKDELLEFFHKFVYHSEIKYPIIKFGGSTGSTIVSIVFTKKSS